MSTNVRHNQSLLDIAIQEHGNLSGLLSFAFINGLSITDDLDIGLQLDIPELETQNNDIVSYFKIQNRILATSLTELDLQLLENNDPCDLCKCFT